MDLIERNSEFDMGTKSLSKKSSGRKRKREESGNDANENLDTGTTSSTRRIHTHSGGERSIPLDSSLNDQDSFSDENAVCCICGNGDSSDCNQIIFCEMCNVAVHQDCYGQPYIPDGPWYCRRCVRSPSTAVSCELCPNKTGAFKQVDTSSMSTTGWCHVSCALWIPEVTFGNTSFLEPIQDIHKVPKTRFNLKCFICKKTKVGACIQCQKPHCYRSFHITCGQKAGLYMHMDSVQKQGAQGQLTVQVIKTAYCQNHSPSDWSPRPIKSTEKKLSSYNKASASDDRVELARKAINSGKELPVTCAPYLPVSEVCKVLLKLTDITAKGQFLQHLLAYWTQKRLAKSGQPLLRREQQNTQTGNMDSPARSRNNRSRHLSNSYRKALLASNSDRAEISQNIVNSGDMQSPDNVEDSLKQEKYESVNKTRQQLIYWRTIRTDLEKVRLNIELVKKRERLKRDLLSQKEDQLNLKCFTLNSVLSDVIDKLKKSDPPPRIFSIPVAEQDAPEYYDIIHEPMDLSTMSQKVEEFKYLSLKDLAEDFDLIIKNCKIYNGKDSYAWKLGLKLRDAGRKIIKDAAIIIDNVGINYSNGQRSGITTKFQSNRSRSTSRDCNEDDKEKPGPSSSRSKTKEASKEISQSIMSKEVTLREPKKQSGEYISHFEYLNFLNSEIKKYKALPDSNTSKNKNIQKNTNERNRILKKIGEIDKKGELSGQEED